MVVVISCLSLLVNGVWALNQCISSRLVSPGFFMFFSYSFFCPKNIYIQLDPCVFPLEIFKKEINNSFLVLLFFQLVFGFGGWVGGLKNNNLFYVIFQSWTIKKLNRICVLLIVFYYTFKSNHTPLLLSYFSFMYCLYLSLRF